ERYPRSRRWSGRTTHGVREIILKRYGVSLERVPGVGPFVGCRSMTLQTFVTRFARPGVRYVVRTTGHVQIVQDGHVIDQGGLKPVLEHWGRRKRVTFAHVVEFPE